MAAKPGDSKQSTSEWNSLKGIFSGIPKGEVTSDSDPDIFKGSSSSSGTSGVLKLRLNPIPDKLGRMTNQLEYLQENVITAVIKHKSASSFLEPSSKTSIAPNGKSTVIGTAMDLNTIKSRLNYRYYWSAKDCLKDFSTVFSHTYVHYDRKHKRYSEAQTLEKFFLGLLVKMPRGEVELKFPSMKVGDNSKLEDGSGDRAKSASPYFTKTSSVTSAIDGPKTDSKPSSRNRSPSVTSALSPNSSAANESIVDGMESSPAPPPKAKRAYKRKSVETETTTGNSTDKDLHHSPKARKLSTGHEPRRSRPEPEETKDAMKPYRIILDELFSRRHKAYAWPFYEPVDVNQLGLHDYLDIIKKPMDLRTVEKNMAAGVYKTGAEFAEDIRLIFDNCYKYNPANEDVINMAKSLERAFEKMYSYYSGSGRMKRKST